VIGKLRIRDQRLGRAARRAHGFTIIELLVVVSLIVILAGMAMAQYRNSVTRAEESVLRTDLHVMRDALDQYYADKQAYPAALDALVSEGYVRAIPKDPFTGSAESWVTVQAEPDPGNPDAPSGVSDVKSGSDRTALDGTRYGEW
jgi:general secretion pathway protein G